MWGRLAAVNIAGGVPTPVINANRLQCIRPLTRV